MVKVSGIYKIALGNSWFYIGSAINLKKREGEHYRELKRGIHHNPKMQSIWNKYNTFEFILLEECAIDNLIVREQIFIDQYFNDSKCVNIAPIAGSSFGIVRSAETRAKISAAWKFRAPPSTETIAKMSAASKGRVHSLETKAKIGAGNKGKIMSAEARAKISVARKGKVHSVETKAKISASGKLRYS